MAPALQTHIDRHASMHMHHSPLIHGANLRRAPVASMQGVAAGSTGLERCSPLDVIRWKARARMEHDSGAISFGSFGVARASPHELGRRSHSGRSKVMRAATARARCDRRRRRRLLVSISTRLRLSRLTFCRHRLTPARDGMTVLGGAQLRRAGFFDGVVSSTASTTSISTR